jgi:hypothetical protein
MRVVCFSVVLASILSVSCGPPPTTGPAEARVVEPNGPTAKLKRIEGQPLYNLEQIVDVVNPLTKPSVTVSALGQLTVSGWAVDRESKASAGGVDIVIDNKPYPAQYELDRNDVAEYFKVPAYSKSGFRLSVAAAAISKGKHGLAVRVISRDGSGYWEGVTVVLEVQ